MSSDGLNRYAVVAMSEDDFTQCLEGAARRYSLAPLDAQGIRNVLIDPDGETVGIVADESHPMGWQGTVEDFR